MNRLDLIIDALSHCAGWGYTDHKKVDAALAAARDLQALQPVAWAAKSIYGEYEGLSFDKQPRFDTPLYALNEVTK
jgi:hypothetical protein